MRWTDSLDQLKQTLETLGDSLALHFEPAVSMLVQCLASGHKILICGNGGSASQANHFAAELIVRYLEDRRSLAAVALTEPSALTACANDYNFHCVFARQVQALGKPGDVLVVLSTSGKSVNINEAVRIAKHRGLGTLGLSGNNGIRAGCDVDITASGTTPRVQEAHQLVIHLLCEAIDERLPKEGSWQTPVLEPRE